MPVDKQFLITRNVPCHRRCIDMEYNPEQGKVSFWCRLFLPDVEDEEGWVDTHHFALGVSQKAISMDEEASSKPPCEAGKTGGNGEEGAALDMDAFIAEGGLEDDDPNRFIVKEDEQVPSDADNVIHTRTYDLHITYDKYYQVPRLWLCGYDEDGQALSVEKMSEDFSQDHINKTITIEYHTHLQTSMASIHPCRHAEVMKRLIGQLAESGKELVVEQYLLIFLKFVQVFFILARKFV
ncbi:unnamed protein product [Gongylonema pulchrum]|uniref:Ubiquitin-like-conjugating enzyme ATG3 n=1 Tax=Gongylonema pulchrum TaxID=637853 RepID=A0A3P6PX80_9BILA|nr:unnamed protein product [Gongylonema pulchrum]